MKSRELKALMLVLLLLLCACAKRLAVPPTIPALEYSKRINGANGKVQAQPVSATNAGAQDARARVQFAAAASEGEGTEPTFYKYESQAPLVRDYNGPLSLGDPGLSASLYQEGQETDLFHDHRAFRPMDLVTIVVSESAEGKKEADTEITSESSFSAGIANFFQVDEHWEGQYPESSEGAGDGLDTSTLIEAEAKSDFKGEGETTRKGSLTARISAMVVEVLPSGILRIEGQKIISVNNEEQVMVISGLVRPRDISSVNEVASAKIAQMRIDYFGKGTVGDAQYGGWMGNLLRKIWPF